MSTQLALIPRMVDELKAAPRIEISFTPVCAYHLAALLQVAARHPHIADDGERMEFIRRVVACVAEIGPAVAESLEMGWNQDFDIKS